MPISQQEERQKRDVVGAKLSLPDDTGWDTIFRVFQCRFHGLGDQATWDEIWTTVWQRYLGLPNHFTQTEILETLSVRTVHQDPCRNLFNLGTLWGLGFSPDDAGVCKGLEETMKAYKLDYMTWLWQVLGRRCSL